MRRFASVMLLATTLVAGTEGPGRPDHFGPVAWSAEVKRLGVDPEEAVYPFGVSPEMEAWLDRIVGRRDHRGDLSWLKRLQSALFDDEFGFTYTAEQTLTATSAFEIRSGNCMSFTTLFVSLARSAGIGTFLMSVQREAGVDREDGLVVLNRHVVAAYRSAVGELATFDFDVQGSAPYLSRRVLDDVAATAIYHSNLGGSAIRAGRASEAVRHLEIATKLAPDWWPAWVNLGVARNRTGDSGGAFDAYRQAIAVDPGNPSALNNMAALYLEQGRISEAEVALRAATARTDSPFTLIAAADAEMVAGNLEQARKYLRKAKRRDGSEPEVYRALARLATKEGKSQSAQKHLRRAQRLDNKAAVSESGRSVQ
jgi:Flp pilus assembly protein TadD